MGQKAADEGQAPAPGRGVVAQRHAQAQRRGQARGAAGLCAEQGARDEEQHQPRCGVPGPAPHAVRQQRGTLPMQRQPKAEEQTVVHPLCPGRQKRAVGLQQPIGVQHANAGQGQREQGNAPGRTPQLCQPPAHPGGDMGCKACQPGMGQRRTQAEPQQHPQEPQVHGGQPLGRAGRGLHQGRVQPPGAACHAVQESQGQRPTQGKDGRPKHHEGQAQPPQPVVCHGVCATTLDQQRHKKARQDEKHRHAKRVDERHQQVGRGRGLVVAPGQGRRPGDVDHGHMQDDAQPHHGGAQVVQGVKPLGAVRAMGVMRGMRGHRRHGPTVDPHVA